MEPVIARLAEVGKEVSTDIGYSSNSAEVRETTGTGLQRR